MKYFWIGVSITFILLLTIYYFIVDMILTPLLLFVLIIFALVHHVCYQFFYTRLPSLFYVLVDQFKEDVE